ncbi:hypothetical protein LSCM1_02205 [Leishmania martiniquensis]|uniref:R3H-associated N-terminal domain-containing protein n=1 Tax=Leishmania martiniquensis TaxID=1580590 RepID=A0A836GQQ8_9TRYP|nr:hypothetical protein LSCM1_02205 [Leishmania martiniquensis]
MFAAESDPASPRPEEIPKATSAPTATVESTATAANTTMTAISSSKGFQVTHTSYQHGNPPFHSLSSPMAPAAFSGPRAGGLPGSPVQPPQLPPSFCRAAAPSPHPRQRSSSSSSSAQSTAATSTPPLGPRTTAVPLITPRYQKKSRTAHQMNVTDSFPIQQTATEALRQEATERMTIQNGSMQYDQEVHFHTYDLYRHGKRQIHVRSVGYSSDGDLILMREDYSEPSDVDNSFVRKRTEISDPTVLDPRARRPLTDAEVKGNRKIHLNRPRYKKYPGIRAPKNRKVRNRLLNDYFAHELAKDILAKARKWRKVKPEESGTPVGPAFTDLPKAVMDAFDLEGEEQLLEFERLRIHPKMLAPPLRNVRAPLDPDSPEARFQGLNTRLRGELQHALNSEFLTQQIEDLEVHFSAFVKSASKSPESLVFHFRDGYGRLICHGVAAYYLLVSESRTVMDGSGTKLTYVSLPKTRRRGVRAVNPPHVPLLLVLKRNRHHLPAKHSLSAQTTPHMAPTPATGAPPPALVLEDDIFGRKAGVNGADVMSPLDLNAPAMPNGGAQPTRSADAGRSAKVPLENVDSAAKVESGLSNPTVFRISTCKQTTTDPLPFYMPMLRLTLSAEQQEDAVKQLDEASTVAVSDVGSLEPSLTATQRKKLRKADRVRSAEASQDNLSTCR